MFISILIFSEIVQQQKDRSAFNLVNKHECRLFFIYQKQTCAYNYLIKYFIFHFSYKYLYIVSLSLNLRGFPLGERTICVDGCISVHFFATLHSVIVVVFILPLLIQTNSCRVHACIWCLSSCALIHIHTYSFAYICLLLSPYVLNIDILFKCRWLYNSLNLKRKHLF